MTLRLEPIYSFIPASAKPAIHLRCDASARPWHYLSGKLCFPSGFAGYDSLLVGFEIVDKRFLLHKSLLDLGVLNFTATALVSNLPR
jgi:hypothetical protein